MNCDCDFCNSSIDNIRKAAEEVASWPQAKLDNAKQAFSEVMPVKVCTKCLIEKPLHAYHKAMRGDKFGLMSWCKRCHAASTKAYKKKHRIRLNAIERDRYKNNPKMRLNQKLKDRYGMSLAEYEELLSKQNGVCAICRGKETSKRKRLSVDHNHTTGAVRALLCHNCNAAVGHVRENVQIALSVAEYIRKHSE